MEMWEHLALGIEKTGGASQVVAITASGSETKAHSTGPVALATVMDDLGRDGWQLAAVDSGMFWMKRRVENSGGGWATSV
jgi:hypothetical protein